MRKAFVGVVDAMKELRVNAATNQLSGEQDQLLDGAGCEVEFGIGDVVALNAKNGGDGGGVVVGLFTPLVVWRNPGGTHDVADADELYLVARRSDAAGTAERACEVASTRVA